MQVPCFCIYFPALPETCVEKAIVLVKQHYTTCKLSNYLTLFEIIPATQLMSTQLGLQTLWLAYLQSLELFSITHLCVYLCAHFLQPFLSGRVQH